MKSFSLDVQVVQHAWPLSEKILQPFQHTCLWFGRLKFKPLHHFLLLEQNHSFDTYHKATNNLAVRVLYLHYITMQYIFLGSVRKSRSLDFSESQVNRLTAGDLFGGRGSLGILWFHCNWNAKKSNQPTIFCNRFCYRKEFIFWSSLFIYLRNNF